MHHLLRSVHYLGYHTKPAMSYTFDEARPFSLVTSNDKEVKEARALLKRDSGMEAAIWVIEGVHSKFVGTPVQYYLREVFHPRSIAKAQRADYDGAKKDYNWRLEGVGKGFGRDLHLIDLPWFPAFREDNGEFGFGLRILRDQDVKAEFLEMARPYFTDDLYCEHLEPLK